MTPLVLFDAASPLCRQLADLAARRAGTALVFRSWQGFQASGDGEALPDAVRAAPADRLRVLVDGALIEGAAAWAFVAEVHRDLAGLNWLAAKVGLTDEVRGRVLERAGGWFRRRCWRCPA